MKLLAIDTATEACSAALWIDGAVCERYVVSPREHTRLIMGMIDELVSEAGIKPADLDALAFGRGPGSFTGVRIATGVVQGIAFALDLPVYPISNLAAVAQNLFDDQPEHCALVAMDARMGEIYWAVYVRNAKAIAVLTGDERVLPPGAIPSPPQPGVGIGTGWPVYGETLARQLGGQCIRHEGASLPRASAIAKLASMQADEGISGVAAELALPVYLRDNVAKKESER
jgi:tRNA threonylcarbamoyladenosine biosynthesis protein TsaB